MSRIFILFLMVYRWICGMLGGKRPEERKSASLPVAEIPGAVPEDMVTKSPRPRPRWVELALGKAKPNRKARRRLAKSR